MVSIFLCLPLLPIRIEIKIKQIISFHYVKFKIEKEKKLESS
jgi:hypothetical protein